MDEMNTWKKYITKELWNYKASDFKDMKIKKRYKRLKKELRNHQRKNYKKENSKFLFAIYIEESVKLLEKENLGIKIQDHQIGIILYADDIIIINSYSCLSTEYSLNNLTGSGFSLVYNQNYSHATSMTDLENIKKINSPVFVGSAYWYMTDGSSFGFAPDSTVNQGSADTHDTSSLYRLSWHLTGSGGWRLGNRTELVFLKITDHIELKHFDSVTKINESTKARTRVECMAHCLKNYLCKYANFKSGQCVIYEFLSYHQDILDGTYWITANKISYESYSCLSTYYSFNNLTGSGFSLVYNQNYYHVTTIAELINIKNQCSSNSVLCAAGGLANSDSLLLISCANCHAVLTPTIINIPVFLGSAYWYLTDGKSFGFAPDSTIHQGNADIYDASSLFRLSWHLTGSGGWRLGNISGLNSHNNYKKYQKKVSTAEAIELPLSHSGETLIPTLRLVPVSKPFANSQF
ncbi:kinesin kif17 [Brachionus plicatilis]|uniref:Kinesin kif17 n=1 Tax=Brachionus plicatilis TaxID=10195 RepID=A0A3M7RGS9_BRAPC|nr:kinesin kif17 [Brachionus plicatilis]